MSQIPETTVALGKLAAGPGNLGLRTQSVRRPAAGQVLVEVLGCGICGTDLHIEDDEFPTVPPVTMGHEVAGVVVEIGAGVASDWMGRRVACETYFFYCEACEFCRTGRPNLCAQRRSIGSAEDGGFSRWLTVPARNLHELPDSVGDAAGALAEPLACVCRCLFDPPVINAGDDVLVIGPGTMGLLTAQAARASGGKVTLVGLDSDRLRLEVAAAMGIATRTVESDTAEWTPPDVVAECSGSAAGAALGLSVIRKGGHYVQVGIFGSPVSIALDELLFREVTVTSGNASTPDSWRRAMRLLREGSVVLDPLVTAVVPLDEWERAFAATRAGTGIKSVIDPRSGP